MSEGGEFLSQIRRAAGSKSLPHLKEAIAASGWTAASLNVAGSDDGKTALHMAAWKGDLGNVRYLVEEMHCDVNVYSRGTFSYGKTAVFFAATQCRADVVRYLLGDSGDDGDARPAKVTVVNNKGQSVRSIASSHGMPADIMDRIGLLEAMEEEDALSPTPSRHMTNSAWWNFRSSHSDHLEYGDLDPRFLDRPLRPADVVTEYAVNPTTKQSRKGAFARRNPNVQWERLEQKEVQQRTTKRQTSKQRAVLISNPSELRAKQETEWKRLWEQLQQQLLEERSVSNDASSDSALTLLRIVQLGTELHRSWIPEAAARLRDVIGLAKRQEDSEHQTELLFEATRISPASEQEIVLLGRIRGKILRPKETHEIANGRKTLVHSFLDSEAWATASAMVQHLSMKQLENGGTSKRAEMLCLPEPPVFVSTASAIDVIHRDLSSRCRLVAIDTEWYDIKGKSGNKVNNALSTLQLAYCRFEGDGAITHSDIQTIVVDLMVTAPDYLTRAQDLIRWILESNNLLVMGFALGHDIPLLLAFVDDCRSTSSSTIPPSRATLRSCILDLQVLLSTDGDDRTTDLPGLKACAAKFSSAPLSKEEQCSNWQLRPLRQSQLEYAGLDAAILLVLLAEFNRTRWNAEARL